MKINTLSYCSMIALVSFFVFLTSSTTGDAFVIDYDDGPEEEEGNFFTNMFARQSSGSSNNINTFSFPDYNPETDVCTVDHNKIMSEEDEVSIDVQITRNTEGDGLLTLAFNDGEFAGLSDVRGWCVDLGRSIGKGNYLFDVFSSLDTSGAIHADAVDKPELLPALNWLMNEIPTGTVIDIPGCVENHMITDQEYQLATWLVIDNATRAEVFDGWKVDGQIEEDTCVVDWLMEEAINNQQNYELDCYNSDAKMGLLLVVDDDNDEILNQVLLAEIDARHACTCVPVTSPPSMAPATSEGGLTESPTASPVKSPSGTPTKLSTGTPTKSPTSSPTGESTKLPTLLPTGKPTSPPTKSLTSSPTKGPSSSPTKAPTLPSMESPISSPTREPTRSPTSFPTGESSKFLTSKPTILGSSSPTLSEAAITKSPILSPTKGPTEGPTKAPTDAPTGPQALNPTPQPTTSAPTRAPSKYSANGVKTELPTISPTESPTKAPADTTMTPQPTGPDPQTATPTPKGTSPQTLDPTPQPTTSTPTRAPSKYNANDVKIELPSSTPSNNQGASGDPHFKTWSGEHYDFHGICDLILLNNPKFNDNLGMDIYIRSKQTKQWSYISAAVVRIGVETFEVSGCNDGDTYWINGIEGDGKSDDSLWEEGTNIAGYPITYQRVHSMQREYTIDLGKNSEKIIVKTWKDFVRVDVVNPREEDFTGSLGLMGSYPDGKIVGRFNPSSSMKDMNTFGQEWQVLSSDPTLFHSVEGPQYPARCKLPSKSSLRRRLSKSEISREDAEIVCSNISNNEERNLCIFDVMATSDKATANAY